MSGLQVFRYETPDATQGKAHVWLARSDVVMAEVQWVGEGGETNLHSHTATDGFWMVLEGLAAFYGEEEEPVAVLDKNEGVFIPRGTPYWFESAGGQPLEILHVGGTAQNVKKQRINHRPPVPHQQLQGSE